MTPPIPLQWGCSRRLPARIMFLELLAVALCLELYMWRASHRVLDDNNDIRSSNAFLHLPPNQHPPVHQRSTRQRQQLQQRLASSEVFEHASTPSYVDDALCGGCRSIAVHQKMQKYCGFFLHRRVRETPNMTMALAARFEVERYGHDMCRPCLADACDRRHKRYWRYDRVSPPLQRRAVTHVLSAIPASYRVPELVLNADNQTQAVEEHAEYQYPQRNYLWEYNPSIVVLPSPQQFTPRKGHGTNSGVQPTYLASYRVSNQQGCFPPDTTLQLIGGSWNKKQKPLQVDHLGLAWLDTNLQMVDDTVVFIPKHPFGQREDFRLFVLHNTLYLATYCKIVPLYVVPREMAHWHDGRPLTDLGELLEPLFLNDTTASMSGMSVWMGHNATLCSLERKVWKSTKNLNYFVNAQNQTVAEMLPLGPHAVKALDLTNARLANDADIVTWDEVPPRPSFYTLEELDFARRHNFFDPPFVWDRGGACCIEFSRTDQMSPPLLLGIGHTKTPHGRTRFQGIVREFQYLSRWYAFEPTPPYRIVAQSGLFCLPGNPNNSRGHDGGDEQVSPLANAYRWNMLRIANTTYDCPAIHFVTGMTTKVGDPDTLIVAYGVADCTAWFIEIKKAHVLQLLFHGPKL